MNTPIDYKDKEWLAIIARMEGAGVLRSYAAQVSWDIIQTLRLNNGRTAESLRFRLVY